MTDQPDLDFTPPENPIHQWACGHCGQPKPNEAGTCSHCGEFPTRNCPSFAPIVPQAHARKTDGQTSRDAAASVKDISETQEQILRILRALGPQTDEEIQLAFVGYCSPSGLRSRRAELVRLGKVRQNAREGRTAANRTCAIWEIVK